MKQRKIKNILELNLQIWFVPLNPRLPFSPGHSSNSLHSSVAAGTGLLLLGKFGHVGKLHIWGSLKLYESWTKTKWISEKIYPSSKFVKNAYLWTENANFCSFFIFVLYYSYFHLLMPPNVVWKLKKLFKKLNFEIFEAQKW